MTRWNPFAAGLVSALLVACQDSRMDSANACAQFTSSLSVRRPDGQSAKAVQLDSSVAFELTLQNTSTSTATLTAGSPCTGVVFQVLDEQNRQRWSSIDEIGCIEALQPHAFAAGEVIGTAATWDTHDSEDALVAPGIYIVNAQANQYATDSQGELVDCRNELSRMERLQLQ